MSPSAPSDASRPVVGTDLVSVADVADSVRAFGYRYLQRIYTPLEIAQSGGASERLAARFAGKEAVAKILRPDPGSGFPYRDIEIASMPTGAPRVRLRGAARDRAALLRLDTISVSLTHDHGLAFATAVTLLPRKDRHPVKDTIRQVLDQYGHLTTPANRLADSDDLYQAGLTSHATVNVMLALEDELDLEFPDELLSRDTFATIAALDEAARSLGASS
ncbi:Aminoacyl carrier protein [Frondihabitans sp. 762G35]|uniref:acyl carrier protein n=1 Tax=Frondihabitans sp. 762G35 TaxID=1446794 RepID=UPI000D20AA89|nr:acyl carrier protein [Frondihabitans sp. 762G35]ARC58035.1 Aminoacyl carrier protein [Frondihabitans sp. 762G35]